MLRRIAECVGGRPLYTKETALSEKERALTFRGAALLWGTDFLKPETLEPKLEESTLQNLQSLSLDARFWQAQSQKSGIEMTHAKFSKLYAAMLGMRLFVQLTKSNSEQP